MARNLKLILSKSSQEEYRQVPAYVLRLQPAW